MINWKNIAVNPPTEDCSILLKRSVGKANHYCLARYCAAGNTVYDIPEYWMNDVETVYHVSELTCDYYIILDEIK